MVNYARNSGMMINFDNNETTEVAAEVLAAMLPFSDTVRGDAASAKVIENARTSVAELLGAADPSEIVFTSGGAESNSFAILGAIDSQPDKRHIITTQAESTETRNLFETLEQQGFSLTWLSLDEQGGLDLGELKDALRPDTALVSITHANGETGVIFPVAEASDVVKANSEALFHTDAVNAAGKIAIDVRNSQIDLLSISGHKFHGPEGVGALYIRDARSRPSLLKGGEYSGVRNIAGIGAAADLVKDLSIMEDVQAVRNRIDNEILQKIPNSRLNGGADRLPNTSNISFENTNGEMIVHRLFEAGFRVSTGSACNSADHTASAVLQAMNVPYSQAMGSIRFSLSRYNTADEVGELLDKLPAIVKRLHAMAG